MADFVGWVKRVYLPTEPMKMLNMVCKINRFTHRKPAGSSSGREAKQLK